MTTPPELPPYQCDPEIVGNAEGNQRDLAKDKTAVAAAQGRTS